MMPVQGEMIFYQLFTISSLHWRRNLPYAKVVVHTLFTSRSSAFLFRRCSCVFLAGETQGRHRGVWNCMEVALKGGMPVSLLLPRASGRTMPRLTLNPTFMPTKVTVPRY